MQSHTVVTLSVNNPTDFPMYRAVVAELTGGGRLPLVEVFLDNFWHLDPALVAEMFADLADDVALHIMWSRFLERPTQDVTGYLDRLTRFVRRLQPVYVSDHLGRFRIGPVHAYSALELTYDDTAPAAQRVQQYQDAIGQPLLVENYASTTPAGVRQVDFVAELMARTGCGLLFDVSNARAAQENDVVPVTAWHPLLRSMTAVRCHLGSYEWDERDELYFDTHGCSPSASALRDLARVSALTDVASICYERDHQRSAAAIVADIRAIELVVRPC
ncbi:MAG: DUF692 family protein [Acidimicrobiales bacterium]|jgi:hypothetical protein|nr:DUF692 family protein [Acidimicrobiales bacterium]